jgi:uncharacterized membrane protein
VPEPHAVNRRPLIAAAMLLGIGLGGFVDGIIFHQILQTHQMLTGKLPPTSVRNIEINMFWDGLFHAFTWASTMTGMTLLWRTGKRPDVPWSTRTFVGGQALGWGLFNLVEGVIDHHILHIHHVVEGAGHIWWDLAFLASGVVLAGIGLTLIARGAVDTLPRGSESRDRLAPSLV